MKVTKRAASGPPVAGIDLGSREHWVCVPSPARNGPSTQAFGTTTPELQRIADWLEAERVESVAMESTYVYWIPLYELLDSRGIEVRRWFCEPACVQGRFGPADERLAADWQRAGVPLETVRRAILLGSVRKSMSLLDRPGGEPVRSLSYFAGLVEEVRTESFPAAYWRHAEFNLRRCERHWRDRRLEQAGGACSDLAQADSSSAG